MGEGGSVSCEFQFVSFWLLRWGSTILYRRGVEKSPLVRRIGQKLLFPPLLFAHPQSRPVPGHLGCHLGQVRSLNSGGVRELGSVGNNSFGEYSGLR